ncbi:MAG TPA: hypothetical protein ENJ87_03590 [Gammaproteobacteria bacterium]|nr:hypothetical protein [Gammaproteobacteria bacterium]
MLKAGNVFIAGIFLLFITGSALANEVEIIGVDLDKTADDKWSVNVTLQHTDTGWDHYADNWRVVDEKGKVLGDRVLHHPHVGEQPFTRGLSAVTIPADNHIVYIEAHDKVHGWSPVRLRVDMAKAVDGKLRIRP